MEAEVLRLFKLATDAMSDPLSDLKIKCLVDVRAGMDSLRDAIIAVIRQPIETPKRTEVFVGDKMLMFYPDRLTQVKVGQAFFVGQKPYTVVKVGVTDYEVRIECTALNTNTKRMDNTAPNNGMPAGETTTSSFLSTRMEKVD